MQPGHHPTEPGVYMPGHVELLGSVFDKAWASVIALGFDASRSGCETVRRRLARNIIYLAEHGETDPDLLWRAAAGRTMVERRMASEAC